MPVAVSSTSTAKLTANPKIVFPDLITACPFPLRMNPQCKQAASTSEAWLMRGGNMSEKKRKAYHGLKAGLLTSMCYPEAQYTELRVCCDYINYLFHLDNISDCMDERGTNRTAEVVMGVLRSPKKYKTSTRIGRMTRDFWKRVIKTGAPAAQRRFIDTFELFFHAVAVQAEHRQSGEIPDLESYIACRRDTSGCKPCWALIEYANNLDIPDQVMSHEVLESLSEAANDLVTWSNDIYSFNIEQSKGDTHNMVVVVMHELGLPMQEAIDFVGSLCMQTFERFVADKRRLPSWGTRIDKDVSVYVQGLEDWIAGNLHWTFETERYFGTTGLDVKAKRVVDLLPCRPRA